MGHNRYSVYFGFYKEEVAQMLAHYGHMDKLSEVCEWYDGYQFGSTELFNPWSAINYYAGEWVAEYITNEKSALSRAYHDVSGNHKASVAAAANYDDPSAVVAEGDTPNFLYIYDVGLRSAENPSYCDLRNC